MRFEAAFQLDIVKEVVVQGFRDVDELLYANVVSFEDGIHVWPRAIDAAGELGHAHSLFVKYLFDKVSDVHSVWFGHRWVFGWIETANLLIRIFFVLGLKSLLFTVLSKLFTALSCRCVKDTKKAWKIPCLNSGLPRPLLPTSFPRRVKHGNLKTYS